MKKYLHLKLNVKKVPHRWVKEGVHCTSYAELYGRKYNCFYYAVKGCLLGEKIKIRAYKMFACCRKCLKDIEHSVCTLYYLVYSAN